MSHCSSNTRRSFSAWSAILDAVRRQRRSSRCGTLGKVPTGGLQTWTCPFGRAMRLHVGLRHPDFRPSFMIGLFGARARVLLRMLTAENGLLNQVQCAPSCRQSSDQRTCGRHRRPTFMTRSGSHAARPIAVCNDVGRKGAPRRVPGRPKSQMAAVGRSAHGFAAWARESDRRARPAGSS